MFVYSFRIKWWRVLCFALLIIIVSLGIYYLTHPWHENISDGMPSVKEVQAWQV